MSKFYEHVIDTTFTYTVRGDDETFYCHCAKHYAPRIARVTLDQLNCGISIWTMQAFEHTNKQSKHFYESKTNGEGNCCKQVLRGLHQRFMSSYKLIVYSITFILRTIN